MTHSITVIRDLVCVNEISSVIFELDNALPLKHNEDIMNRLDTEKRARVIGALVEGNSIRSTCRMTGVCKDAVLKLIRDMGAACSAHHNATVRHVKTARVQCDEIWSFCYSKEKNVPVAKQGTGAGSVGRGLLLMRILSWYCPTCAVDVTQNGLADLWRI